MSFSQFYDLGRSETIDSSSGTSGIAVINKTTPHDYPEETDLGRNNDELYIAGGLTREFNT